MLIPVLQNQQNRTLSVTMSKKEHPEAIRRRVAAHTARKAAAGLVPMSFYIPIELVEEIDRLKQERGEPSRAPVVIEAVRTYIETIRA